VRFSLSGTPHQRAQISEPAESEIVDDDFGWDICSVAELDEHGRMVVSIPDVEIDVLLVKAPGRIYALHNRCPHAGAALDQRGVVVNRTITCAAHGRRFELDGGRCVGRSREPARTLTTLRAWAVDGRVLVAPRSRMPMPSR
jgi:nitrite reductase/ring-hydroxylating ferredoxin subunit